MTPRRLGRLDTANPIGIINAPDLKLGVSNPGCAGLFFCPPDQSLAKLNPRSFIFSLHCQAHRITVSAIGDYVVNI